MSAVTCFLPEDETLIHDVVHVFYSKICNDAMLAPIFENAIQEGWDRHLARMVDFWSNVMLSNKRYKGEPLLVHVRLAHLRPEHFARWLMLFQQTLDERCPQQAKHQQFMRRAELIGAGIKRWVAFYREHDPEWTPELLG